MQIPGLMARQTERWWQESGGAQGGRGVSRAAGGALIIAALSALLIGGLVWTRGPRNGGRRPRLRAIPGGRDREEEAEKAKTKESREKTGEGEQIPEKTPKSRIPFDTRERDAVDEASVESFPASDAPGW